MQKNVEKAPLVVEHAGFPYVVYESEREPGEKLPLIVFLHGAGERGEDFQLIKVHGIPKIFDKENVPYRCVAVSPQCPIGSYWATETAALKIFIDEMIQKYDIDEDRVILTGISMGGYGTWFMAERYPEMFAAIAPVCGGGMPWSAGVLTMPVWAFHGDLDTVVPTFESIAMHEKLKTFNQNAQLTILHNVGHNAWEYAYGDDLIQWMLAQNRKNNP